MTDRKKCLCFAESFWAGVIVAAAGVLGAVYYARFPRSYFLGDGYIYLCYARNLAAGLGWTFNAGEASFATTSPLFTLLLAAVHAAVRPSRDLFIAQAAMTGLFVYLLYLLVFHRLLARMTPEKPVRLALFAIAALVPYGGLIYSVSAMETSLYLLLFFLLVFDFGSADRSGRAGVRFGAAAGLLFLTRPEGAAVLLSIWAVTFLLKEEGAVRRVILSSGAGFALVVLPWEIFQYMQAGVWVPTSGLGRVYGSLALTLPGVSVAEYMDASVLQKILWFGTVFKNRVWMHPVMMGFCAAPAAILTALFFMFRVRFGGDVRRRRTALFLVLYAWLNIALYFYFHPALYQRYLAALFPSSLLMTAMAAPPLGIRARRALAAGTAAALLVMIAAGFPYYAKGARLNRMILEALESAPELQEEGRRLAAEPLGLAGYFTACYVIDTSGLVNPDVWEYRRRGQSFEEYARDRGADYYYFEYRITPIGPDRPRSSEGHISIVN